jgi:HSP20 family protein
MANITRYAPASGVLPLREAMNRLVQDAFTWPGPMEGSNGGWQGMWTMPSNLYEQKDSYVLQLALPGADAEKVEIIAQQNVMQLKGTYRSVTPEGATAVWANLPGGDFSYQFSLPAELDPTEATAAYNDGILTVTVPKATHAKTHTIKIGTKGGK